MFINNCLYCYRPRRSRQSSVEKALANSQSCEQLANSSSSSVLTNSPVKTLYSLPERLSECDNVDCREVQMVEDGDVCNTCKRPIDSCEHIQISLPTPLDVTTQTKRKKNFMDRCVNKVRLCWWLLSLGAAVNTGSALRVCKMNCSATFPLSTCRSLWNTTASANLRIL